ncbi:hypothetical protein EYF80_040159 [Liparis tanakae]|uniref:Uncharacterized protein n=1 Tax=Liparis tanakae TaxID=230148 RepID=A0A4Z2GAP2_9TELE|nr:hypothetical protein EYF80_040159 [Liparis tanakae]
MALCGVPSDVPRTGDVTWGPRWREGFGVYHRPPLKPVEPSAVEGFALKNIECLSSFLSFAAAPPSPSLLQQVVISG